MNPIIRKIQKLLRLAKDQTGAPEGESAARLAERLMRAHAIEIKDLPEDDQDKIDPIVEESIFIQRLGWYAELMWGLADHCNVTAFRVTLKKGSSMKIIGHKTDVEIIEYLYEVALNQINAAYEAHRREMRLNGRKLSRKDAVSFKTSATKGFVDKLEKMRKDAKNAAGTSLVLSRGAKSAAVADSLYPDVGTFKPKTPPHSSAGYAAGGEINISAGIEAAAQKRIE